jgi:pimeloyl-ACP methyl ester carboxylesterase
MSETPTESSTPDTIVLIHGLWMTPRSWENWIDRYTKAGYSVLAPAWPGLDVEVEELRKDPSPLVGLGIVEVVDHYDRIIRGLEKPPIIMGHSFGGAITQMLLDRGLGACGVTIDSAPVKGVLKLPISTLKSNFPVLSNPANRKKAIALTPKQFHTIFAPALSEEESDKAYERYHVPGSGRMIFQAAFQNANPKAPKVNFGNDDRAPLLFIAGGADVLIPPSLNLANAKKYLKSKSIIAYKEYPGRCHFTVGQDGWEEVADYALDWAKKPVQTGIA